MTVVDQVVRRRWRRLFRGPLRVLRRSTLPLARAYVAAGGPSTGRRSARDRPRLTFLLLDASAQGGTVRTVLEVLRDLVDDYDVEVVSILRDADRPAFALPDGVGLRVLHDRCDRGSTPGPVRWASRLPSVLWHDAEQAYPELSLLDDVRLLRMLRALDTDVLVGTRHGLTILLGELAPDVLTVAQVHLATVQQHPDVRAAVARLSRRLDAVAVLSEDEQREHEQMLQGSRTTLVRIPNPVPALGGGTSDTTAKVAVAIGRLRAQKGFDLLVPAFAGVVAVRPDWQLRIFGEGSQQDELERLIAEHGLSRHVELRGWSSDVGVELAQSSVFVLSSRSEGFPMVLLEAMSKGLPVVSFDCPHGPGEIVRSGEDGLLVAAEDVQGLTAALLTMIEDDDRRALMGRAAQERAQDFARPRVVGMWKQFYGDLLATRRSGHDAVVRALPAVSRTPVPSAHADRCRCDRDAAGA